MVGDLAVLDAHYIDGLEVDLAVSWSHTKKLSFMRGVVGFVRRHAIAIGKLPVDLGMKVWKCSTNMGVEFSHAGFVGSRVRLWCVIDEIVSEEFLENFEVSPSLDLFRISADNGLCRFG